ncbi:MAG: adenylosuccinate synthase [Endomicrobiia bacterium]
MPVIVVVGAQWGDEGKGKVIHFLGQKADYIVRYQGGPNAGHTIILDDGKPFVLHTVPSGIVLPEKLCLITNGVVIDPDILSEEISLLEEKGISVKNRLFISEKAHIIFPYHRYLDELRERGKIRIGTTKRGIGPAYADKVVRIGIRAIDLLEKDIFLDLLERNLKEKESLLEEIVSIKELRKEILKKYPNWVKLLAPLVKDTSLILDKAIKENKKILFESAQGTLLDLDFGTYPYVTSSNPVSGGACVGAGIGPTKINSVIGVIKAYTTRVGEGPFPTELKNKLGDILRERGLEYGATTGRPRRCGWFDTVLVRHSVRVNGIDSLVITKLDCLEGIDPLKICIAYRYNGKLLKDFPSSRKVISKVKPVYITLKGFSGSIRNIKNFDSLPENAKKYIKTIEEYVNTKISFVSMGRTKEETIIIDRKEIF